MTYSKGIFTKLISVLLIFAMLLSLTACAKSKPTPAVPSGSQTFNEQIIEETVISESALDEFITEEIYLKEIVIAEAKISELLLEDQQINEVILCRTIYVAQDNIGEFSENSQVSQLFGPNVDIGPLLTKVAVGTGVIVTVVVLSKAGLKGPIASIVASAADKAPAFAKTGAALGTLFGGLNGAADAIDETGRTSAVIAFATATAGLILTAVSLIAAVPSAGSSTIPTVAGIKLVIAGVGMLGATAGTVSAGYNAVKTFTSTDAADIDWKHINWKKVGVSSAEKAIEDAADGYMWGSIIGTVYGGIEGGLDYFQKYHAPYTNYADRLNQTPKDGSIGHWSGARGESDFILDTPIELPDGTKITQVTYRNAIPDFSPYRTAQVNIPQMNTSRASNFAQADEALAKYWSDIRYNDRLWTRADIKSYRQDNHLTWHEMSNMEAMQLVPFDVNDKFLHYGGVAECKAMLGQGGTAGFD